MLVFGYNINKKSHEGKQSQAATTKILIMLASKNINQQNPHQ